MALPLFTRLACCHPAQMFLVLGRSRRRAAVHVKYRPRHVYGDIVAAVLPTICGYPPPLLPLRFRVGDLDLPERRKRYTSNREEDMDARMCPCGTTIE